MLRVHQRLLRLAPSLGLRSADALGRVEAFLSLDPPISSRAMVTSQSTQATPDGQTAPFDPPSSYQDHARERRHAEGALGVGLVQFVLEHDQLVVAVIRQHSGCASRRAWAP